VAATGIIIAVGVNSVAKGALAASIGGKAFGLRVGAPLVVSAVLGLSIVWGLR
jgi:uncharacterized membrane protein (DUF4010 family)